MLRGVDNEELSGVNSRIWHAYGTATPIERLYSIPQLPQSATASVAWRQPCLSSVMPCTPSTQYSMVQIWQL
jgi:hypothetical protein